MATIGYEIKTTEWTRITAAGESGTCWKKTGKPILIDHTTAETADTLPTSNTNVTVRKSKYVPLDGPNDTVLGIPADDSSDIFYAIALEGEGKLVVDATG